MEFNSRRSGLRQALCVRQGVAKRLGPEQQPSWRTCESLRKKNKPANQNPTAETCAADDGRWPSWGSSRYLYLPHVGEGDDAPEASQDEREHEGRQHSQYAQHEVNSANDRSVCAHVG